MAQTVFYTQPRDDMPAEGDNISRGIQPVNDVDVFHNRNNRVINLRAENDVLIYCSAEYA